MLRIFLCPDRTHSVIRFFLFEDVEDLGSTRLFVTVEITARLFRPLFRLCRNLLLETEIERLQMLIKELQEGEHAQRKDYDNFLVSLSVE